MGKSLFSYLRLIHYFLGVKNFFFLPVGIGMRCQRYDLASSTPYSPDTWSAIYY